MTDGTTMPKPPSPWQPETNPVRLAIYGKWQEELGECNSAIARCLCQGIDECDPETGKPNRQWLSEEIADIIMGYELAVEHFGLDMEFIRARADAKKAHKKEWHKLIRPRRLDENLNYDAWEA